MYGVPEELPLAGFVGQDLVDPKGAALDASEDHEARDCYRLHRLLSLPVVGFAIDAPRSFTLVFGAGYRLTIYDDDPHYESFTLQLRGEGLWVV